MANDKRYNTVKKLISGDLIKGFSEIIDTVPKTILARDLGMHHQTLGKLINNPEGFTLKDAIRIAALIGVDDMKIITLMYSQIVMNGKGKGKK